MSEPTPEGTHDEIDFESKPPESVPTPDPAAEDYDFKAKPLGQNDLFEVPEDYNATGIQDADGRDVYARNRSGRAAYLRVDPPCPKCGRYEFEYKREAPIAEGDDPVVERIETHKGADHEYLGTKREPDPDNPGYDRVTFPIMKSREIVKMGMDEIENEEGTLWTLREKVREAKFHLLKRVVAEGNHMVGDLTASVVIEFECQTLTDKAKMIVRVAPDAETVQLLLPNGNFRASSL